MPSSATPQAPYRSTAPDKTRVLVHPRRITREAVVGAVVWLCAVWVAWQFLLQAGAGVFGMMVTLILLLGATASVLSIRRSVLTLEPARRRLSVAHRRGPFTGGAWSIDLGEVDALAIQSITPTNFRLLLTAAGRTPLSLTDDLVLDEAQIREEFARVHRFLFPERALPTLPAGSIVPVCVVAALTPSGTNLLRAAGSKPAGARRGAR